MSGLIVPWAWLFFPAIVAMGDASVPSDFKLEVKIHGVPGNPPGIAGVMVVRKGIAYQFLSDQRDEVQIVDPVGPQITLINLKQRVQTVVTPAQLDDSIARLRHAVARAAERRKTSADRADRVSAEMSRDLIDPSFKETYVEKEHRIRLTNSTVEVEATGEPEPDALRLKTMHTSFAALAKIGALRSPENIPPFTQVETLRSVMAVHHLRPTEITYLYRLAGPPMKLRWTCRVLPGLTDDDREAISRINGLHATARSVPFAEFNPID